MSHFEEKGAVTMSGTPLGRFCWYELMTPDPDAAPAFYAAVAGWGTAPFDGAGKPYLMWTNGETPIGGVMELPSEAKEMGAPPHWLAHISTPDLPATVARIKELGGAIVAGPMTIPTVGDFAVVQDPQGAVFSAYQPAGDAPGHDGLPGVGEFSWTELVTSDREAAWSFYSGVFGWELTEAMDMGPGGIYQMFSRGAHPLGGFYNLPEGMTTPAWLFYVRVPDADAAVEKVKELGGSVLNGPMEVPGGGRVAQCLDPQGAAFAVHSESAEG